MDIIRLRVEKTQEEIRDFKTIVFREAHNIRYKAGQYLTFMHQTPFEQIRRSYSIVSSPALNEPLAIGVKRIPNGIFSRILVDNTSPGDELLCLGAGGFFTLPEDVSDLGQVYFFAAGSGITPVFSLIKTVLYAHELVKAVLIYSCHSKQHIIYGDQLRLLLEQFPGRFNLHFLLSDAPLLDEARLNRELLVKLVGRYAFSDLTRALYYICGPEPYMRMCSYALQEQNIPKDNIKRENFALDKRTPPKTAPPEKNAHHVRLKFRGNEIELRVQYPETILQAAKKKGIQLPYSCEVGKCGSCAARCTIGNIWLSYNEVLTDSQLTEGLTLTCVGTPVYGDAELVID